MTTNVSDRDLAFCLRLLSHTVRDSPAPASAEASDTAVLEAVRKLYALCKEDESGDLVARVYPQIAKLFQRFCASGAAMRPSHGLILLAVLQYFLDYGESVLHDSDPSLRQFFRSSLSRLYADPAVAKATLDFLNQNKTKLLLFHASLLSQFFPLLFKIIAWGDSKLDYAFMELLPALVGPSSFLPLFPAILDLPSLVLALESLEQRTGTLISVNGAVARKSPAPEALLALMDEAYTGGVGGGGAESGDEGESTSRDETDALFADLLKDENEGLPERHWSFPGMAAALQIAMGGTQSDRLKHAFRLAPTLLQIYFDVALRDVNDSLICALLPILFWRVDAMFPDKDFSTEARKKCMEFTLAALKQSPHFIAVLKKPIMDRIGQTYTTITKAELALQLCWAVGEYGGGGPDHKDAARELFESLELVLYENLSSSRAARISLSADTWLKTPGSMTPGTPAQARLLCFVVTAIAKLSTCHRELLPRARVCLAKVARSHQVVDKAVWRRARDYLGLMHEPAICSSILGSSVGYRNHPTNIQWADGDTKAVASIPFYLLGEKEGPPFHDFSLADVIKALA
ncbi:AP-5 complex subunit zeta-1 [Marchantia polymorpha subsp. ruderalis]|uniref:AP-5 complex subunit zeta-1 n=1 Tax=Marchantia polymorpha TaxID=3197 RepID=A0A2R6XDF6_MARPO|nr:hypothetical protein MARPO_0021s0009 [Marchantia polymorpha]BBN01203.1 hypothetical protein Mp_2g05520 [Marchantia polymorpha subsp. ruderalis]|eukprot:PTQ44126.1 hypothetical protein MARPO_0021s0009 [Marchantia polymorpha]